MNIGTFTYKELDYRLACLWDQVGRILLLDGDFL